MRYVHGSAWWAVGLCLLAGCPKGDKVVDSPGLADAGEYEPDEPAEDGPDAGATPQRDERPNTGKSSDKPSSPAAASDAGTAQPSPAGSKTDKPNTPNGGNTGDKPSTPNAPSAPAVQAGEQRFFLPTPEPTNTTFPHLTRDAKGGTHALYPRYAGGGAFYAYCAKAECGAADWTPVRLDTEGSVTNAALALTADGKPRVLLSTLLHVYYAQCDASCTESRNWTTSVIVDHQGAQDVTGQALALDPQGRPRFVMHTYLAYLGVGQKTPRTWFAQCDANCNEPSSWRSDEISDFILYGSQLVYDSTGRAHLLTGVENADGKTAGFKQAAYFECQSGCESTDAWFGLGLVPLYENGIKEIPVSLSLALTRRNSPRIALLARDDTFQPHLMYLECDENCVEDNWRVSTLNDSMKLGPGIDLELDSQDRPRFAFTLEDNIGLYTCNDASCAANGANWILNKVEFANDLPPDSIILWWNCTIDVWVLHSPSLALTASGGAQVAYVATDLSGGFSVVDPMKPRCDPGKDMTLTRMTSLPSYK